MPWVEEQRLDDPEALRALDTRDSLRALALAGAQVRRARSVGARAGVERPAAATGLAPCSSRPSAGPASSATCSTSSPSRVRPSPSPPVAIPRCPAGSAPSTWSSRSPSPVAPAARSPSPPRRPVAAPPCSPSARPAPRSPRSARGPAACTSTAALPTPSRGRPLVAADPGAGRRRRAGLVDCPALLERCADVLDEVAEECRPAPSPSSTRPRCSPPGSARPCRSCSATVRSPVWPPPGPRACWRAPPGYPPRTAPYRMPRRRSSPASTGRSRSTRPGRAQRAPGGNGATSSPTPSWTPPLHRDSGCWPRERPRPRPGPVALADAVVASARDSGVRIWEQITARRVRSCGSRPVALTDFAATYLALGLGLDPSVRARRRAARPHLLTLPVTI